MNHQLDTVLAECDELGVALWSSGGKLAFRAGEFGFPDHLRDALRAHRDELCALLADCPRPDPEWVPFVARNLTVCWFEFGLVKTVPVLFIDQRPHYRLTPSTWVRFCLAIDNRAASILNDPVASDEVRTGAELLVSLGEWVRAYYRHDQIRRAWHNPHPLPALPRGPFAFLTDPQEPVRCQSNPKSSGCAPKSSGPTNAPRPTAGATIATGSDCVPWC